MTMDKKIESSTNSTLSPTSMMPVLPKPAHDKIEYLDGLRGAICFIVAIVHFVLGLDCSLSPEDRHWWAQYPAAWIRDGDFAVILFFIISGRVVAESYRRKPSVELMAKSMFKRGLRLCFPVFALFVWIHVTNYELKPLQWLNYPDSASNLCYGDMGWWGNNFIRPSYRPFRQMCTDIWTMLFVEWPWTPAGVLWTIPVEFKYSYIIYALAMVTCAIKWKWPVLFVVFAVVWPLDNFHGVSFVFGYIMSEFEDTALFKLLRSSNAKRISFTWVLTTAIKLGIAYYGYYLRSNRFEFRQSNFTYQP